LPKNIKHKNGYVLQDEMLIIDQTPCSSIDLMLTMAMS